MCGNVGGGAGELLEVCLFFSSLSLRACGCVWARAPIGFPSVASVRQRGEARPMRLNADTTLTSPATPSIRLVPYTDSHVTPYHAWMEDDGLRAATGSERLSAAEEAAMQAAWAADADKLTFIILDAARLAGAEGAGMSRREAELGAMVGDVNLFLLQEEGEDDEGEGEMKTGEVEVMVAVAASRGRGLGGQAVRLLLSYARAHLGLTRVVAKIKRGNAPSRRLFAGRLGFEVEKEVPVFDEVHLRAGLPAAGAPHPALVGEWHEGAYGEWLDGGT